MEKSVHNQEPTSGSDPGFWIRNEFLIRRLHSLCGLVPVGAFMTVHLLTNASVNAGAGVFQKNVYTIHSLGPLLPFVEWVFIFIPLMFHAILGVVIIRSGSSNTRQYPLSGNVRYTMQRITGMIAFVFIMWHVFHMHGWLHADAWLGVARKFMGAQFAPYNATSSAGHAMQASIIIPILYAIGVLASVYHFANGIWTMGITWGVWISPAAQKRASYVCTLFGIGLAVVGLSAVVGFQRVDVKDALKLEERMYQARVESGDITESEHKRASSADGVQPNDDPPRTDGELDSAATTLSPAPR